ncbi:DUF1642 domain-containing protein [Lactococcus lactis]|nr:DUF1642 domain-containing protein [Lactococcus lactis]MDX6024476.1 DUF1642 domain-containing protein [Lactococcus lactis subsp. lactis]QPT51241.1 DUF1642 domain-containing protein [Lactococcus lactis]TDG83584.1 hypothetical protein C5L15_001769 [Lactococcus lactis subsp. lactis]GAM80112.1 histidyl-tRNA synthetase [Lactococcus lactis subsp. lactis]
MTKFEEEFNYLIELSGKVLLGQVDAETFEKNRIAFFEKYETDQQQDLPVVPEDVDKAIKYLKTQNNFATLSDFDDILTEKGFWWLNHFQFKDRRFGFGGLNNKLFILSHLAITGYTVEKPQIEKPQLFYIALPKVFGLSDSTSDSTFVSKAESGIISEFTKGKDYALKLTEQEIKSIDERYWQFAVPVEDGE